MKADGHTEVFLTVDGMAMALSYNPGFQTTSCHILTVRSVTNHRLSLPRSPFIKWQIKVRMEGISCRQPAETVCYTLAIHFEETLNLLPVLKNWQRSHTKKKCAFLASSRKLGDWATSFAFHNSSRWMVLIHSYCILLGHRLVFQPATVPTIPSQCHLASIIHLYIFSSLRYSLKSLDCENSSTFRTID